jgi:hypothetical protein
VPLVAVLALEARGAQLAGVMATATAGLVEVLAEAISTGAWRGAGIRSVEHWAAVRFGLSARRARRLADAARALAQLPACRVSFAAGAITEDHVTAVVRAGVGPTHDAQTATLAQQATVGQLRRALSFLPPSPPGEGAPPASPTAGGERLWTGFGDDGAWFIHGRGDADRGAVFERALQAARDQLYRARHGDERDPEPGEVAAIGAMDALEHLARRALDAMDPATASGRPPSERYLIDYHLPATDPDLGRFHLGPPLPAWLQSLIPCDADIRTWITTAEGNVNLGHRQHTVDPKLRKFVEHRDGGCVIPGCDTTVALHIHHLHHWADGGPTDTPNLVALCRAHHRLVHRGELILAGNPDAGTLTVTTADGRPIGPSPPRPPDAAPPTAAAHAGLPAAQWTNRSGERADWRWFTWRDQPTTPYDQN